MSPHKSVDGDERVTFELTDEDRALIEQFEVGSYAEIDDAVSHEVCIMQLVSLVTTETRTLDQMDEQQREWREYCDGLGDYVESPDTVDDHPICVSESITTAMIQVNDAVATHDERQRLKDLIPLVMGTCPVRLREDSEGPYEDRDVTDEYLDLEARRGNLLGPIYSAASFDECVELIRQAAEMS